MRLTLRTLLAYLDRILDEEDAGELEQKIRDSEIAPHLIQRIEKTLKQRRSDAIAVDATGLGNDANSVAEYLDNTLPADDVPDFERVCLESDDHLAEVAACHQILTLVLGEPAEVPAQLKQRIYRLPTGDRVSSAAEQVLSAAAEPAPTAGMRLRVDASTASVSPDRNADLDAAEIDEDERWTEAPDYLKRPRRRAWMTPVVVMLIAFCLAMAGLRALGPFNDQHPLAQRFGVTSPGSEADPDAALADSVPAGTETADDGSPITGELALSTAAVPPPGTETDQIGDARPDLEPMAEFSDPLALESDGQATVSSEPLAADPPQPGARSAATSSGAEAETETSTADPTGLDLETSDIVGGPGQPGTERVAADDGEDLTDAASIAERVQPEASFTETANGEFDSSLTDDVDLGFPREVDSDLEPAAGETVAADASSVADAAAPDRLAAVPATSPAVTATPDEPPLPPSLINPLATNRRDVSNEPAETIPALPTSADELQAAAEEAAAVPREPTVIFDVGRFLDEQQVLITYDEASSQWVRVESGARLHAGRELMTLPLYRVPLSLASGLQVTMIGATRGQLLPITDADQTPAMRLRYGRLIVATFSQAGTTFALRWGEDQQATIRLTDMETTFAVELRQAFPPGTALGSEAPVQVLNLYMISGQAEWTTPETSLPIQLTKGQQLSYVSGRAVKLADMDEVPAWVDGSDAKPRDPLAASDLAQKLTSDRPITLSLREQAESRQLEIRSLAACSLAQFDEFDPLLIALNDTDLRSYWDNQYQVLMAAARRSPSAAEALQRSIQQKHGAALAGEMLRLIAGYSPEQLAGGGAEQLVALLDHPSCDMRVLASEMLKEITGLPSLYRAHGNARQRRAPIARWKRYLENNEIVYAEEPELVRLLNDE